MAHKRFYLVVDTETANTLDDPFVYDWVWQLLTKQAKFMRVILL